MDNPSNDTCTNCSILQHFIKMLIWPTFHWFSFKPIINITFFQLKKNTFSFTNNHLLHQQFINFFRKIICISSVRHMASGPLGLGHWPKHTLKTFLSPNLMVCPFHWSQVKQAHADHVWLGRGLHLLGAARNLGSLVLSWGISLPSNLLEAGTSSNAITIVSKETHSLLGIIRSGPTHTSETRR